MACPSKLQRRRISFHFYCILEYRSFLSTTYPATYSQFFYDPVFLPLPRLYNQTIFWTMKIFSLNQCQTNMIQIYIVFRSTIGVIFTTLIFLKLNQFNNWIKILAVKEIVVTVGDFLAKTTNLMVQFECSITQHLGNMSAICQKYCAYFLIRSIV